ncbi:hypothetical protein ACFO5R_21180 [Halosolutus amylolyticus]|uniref:Uncharacterized protein n=1 Tax=Halosolutus amylolyticus TaxID=2932267 RepID=A0ABD5PVF8_9EURY|nr:hypothetical protein [Halosolutus amylolyticus]
MADLEEPVVFGVLAPVARHFVGVFERFAGNPYSSADLVTIGDSNEILEVQYGVLPFIGRSGRDIDGAVDHDLVGVVPESVLDVIRPFSAVNDAEVERTRSFSNGGASGCEEGAPGCKSPEEATAVHTAYWYTDLKALYPF